jgi:hypothetical protein
LLSKPAKFTAAKGASSRGQRPASGDLCLMEREHLHSLRRQKKKLLKFKGIPPMSAFGGRGLY